METVKKDVLQEYISWNNLDVLENANRYPGPTGFFAYVMEEALKESISLVPEDGRKAHFSGDIYIHKLPYSLYIPYCSGHSTSRLLKKGLRTPTITSRPAKHFDTYVDHIANYLITMQHYFSGAQALSSVEWYAGPFIRKDGLNREKIRQHVQRLIYNLNYPSRVGMQTPFTNFTVTLDAPKGMPLERLLKAELVDHIATDLKAPPEELYGLPFEASRRLWELFLEGLRIVSEYGVPLELRVPVARGLEQWPWVERALREVETDFYVVLNPLVGTPMTSPRDREWCSKHCWPEGEIGFLREKLEDVGVRVYVNHFV
ncbi:Ribonucleotide reductase of class III (anaerobic), large subunit [Thermococcus sp. 2319x1]|uniref:anaerobic ribonucleoside-triphosphate reductase n=1 Tax=Thermococcus sp. 2319x1 TaxID=1674923 RepID=UPI00073ACC14|nr:anaerobic ribonucleoside-triphosphate reductase [Thermococcus sp. 2319x1]ALV62813.1 Ribonucleotide reductase of class III (anaerobic), large subunit [Thermococcus sp. 2319x1]